MSTVKISQLPNIPGGLDANTSNSLFLGVDIPTGITGKFTATQLAERLYANNVLNVGDNPIVLPDVAAQFAGDSEQYLQINLQNSIANGSADYVATADIGTDTANYIDLGINNSNYGTGALDGYLVVAGDGIGDPGGNLMIGSITSGKQIEFVIGGFESANVVARMIDDTGFRLTKKPIIFADGTSQNTAAESASFSQEAFATANVAAANTVAINTLATSAYSRANTASANTIYLQAVNDEQNTNITSVNNLAGAAYAEANTASSNTIYLQGVCDDQNTNIISVDTFTQAAFESANAGVILANSAYNKANNALANTSGIFDGNLTITGNTNAQAVNTANLIVSGTANVSGTLNVVGNVTMVANTYLTGAVTVNSTMVLANSNFSASEAAFRITAAGGSQTPTQAGTLMQLTSRANTPARVLVDSFGTSNTAYPIIAGRNARGTVDAPTATQNNDILLRIAGNSYGTTGYAPFGAARIDFIASENQSDTNRGSRIIFYNTPNGSNVINQIASFNADTVEFTGTVAPDKGFIYTPTILQGAQTAFTIDFTTTSLIKADLTADLTITLSNYVYGKVVEVWLTNTSGNPRTVTHGCTALNSTTNSTTFTMSATSSAYLRYFSIDGDQANTFVSVQFA